MIHSTLKPGVYVGRYRVEAFVEKGGMGEVYRAYDPMLERDVALKSIRREQRSDQVSLERFQREARTLAQLNHPTICQVYDWIDLGDALYMAMEWVPGTTLTEYLKEPRPLARVLEILEAVADALSASHALSVVHRDLKPNNILVLPDGRVKVLDFGLAKSTEEHRRPGDEAPTQAMATLPRLVLGGTQETQVHTAGRESHPHTLTAAGTFMGTVGYMSPEQIMGLWVGPPSDLFALGILAHEMLTGEAPFPGKGMEHIHAVALNQRKPLPPLATGKHWPRKLRRLVEAMLHPKPESRPTAPQILHTLRALRSPLSAVKVGALATAASLLLAGGVYVLAGRGIIRDLTRERPARLAILPIRNNTGDPQLEALVHVGLTEMLGGALRDIPKVAVVDPEETAKAYQRLGLDADRPLDPAPLQRLAKALGASLFLQGAVTQGAQHAHRFAYTLLDAKGRTRTRGEELGGGSSDFVPNLYLEGTLQTLHHAIAPLSPTPRLAPALTLPVEGLKAYAEGLSLFNKGQYRDAEPLLRTAAYQNPSFAPAARAYAIDLLQLGKEEARPVIMWSIQAAHATGDRATEARALRVLGDLAETRGERPFAERCYQDALTLARVVRDSVMEASCLNQLGILIQARGDSEEAKKKFLEALDLGQKAGAMDFLPLPLTGLANLALATGDLPEAESRYKAILEAYRALAIPHGEAATLNNLGVLYIRANQISNAEALLNQALTLRRSLGDAIGEGSTLRNLGVTAFMRKDFVQAGSNFQDSLDLARRIQHPNMEAQAIYFLAEIKRYQKAFGRAKTSFLLAAELHQRAGSVHGRADCLAGAAESIIRSNPKAIPEANHILDQMSEDARQRPPALRARAWILVSQGRSKEAMEIVKLALADTKHQSTEIHWELQEILKKGFRP